MILRLLLALVLTLGFGAKSWACSCAPWSGHVSDFAQTYISVWAVPIEAKVDTENIGKPGSGVTYTLEILEGYDVVKPSKISVVSSVADGGTCGTQLIFGTAQFISAIDYGDEFYAVSSCTPKPPYDAVKRYLETGEDSFIPEWSKCHSWPKGSFGHPITFNKEIEECDVWKDADHVNGFMGAKDQRKYRKVWLDKIEATKSKKKTRSWWPFNKD